MFLRPMLGGLVAALSLAACGPSASPPSTQATPAAAAAPAGYTPVATVQELMQGFVDPTADTLWESVSTTVTKAGVEEHRPQTDAEWHELSLLAMRLAEAGNLLALPDRKVAREGKALEDAHVKATLDAAAIQQRIDAEPEVFAGHGRALRDTALLLRAAIDAKDVERFIEVGARLDQACEACHQRYWYPDDRRPTK
ncbi:hypothetical protein [Derxia gummosa]|uniref:Cytochrome c n=1 Tax=Derxia gummosa DSM 723 TaxID=1121388 RepID=A0A8B6X3P5_9BURK|nr:hypothetical protein [Derxia gummosa]